MTRVRGQVLLSHYVPYRLAVFRQYPVVVVLVRVTSSFSVYVSVDVLRSLLALSKKTQSDPKGRTTRLTTFVSYTVTAGSHCPSSCTPTRQTLGLSTRGSSTVNGRPTSTYCPSSRFSPREGRAVTRP